MGIGEGLTGLPSWVIMMALVQHSTGCTAAGRCGTASSS